MDLVRALDDALCATPALHALPGRFLFALDDGRGDIARLGADVTLVADGSRVTIGGFAVARADAVQAMLAIAAAFLAERGAQQSQAWRIAELDDGVHVVAERALRMLPGIDVAPVPAAELPPAPPKPAGPLRQADGRTALTLLAPLGRLTREQAGLLAEHSAPRGLRITPWRSIVLPDLAEDAAVTTATDAANAGLGTGPDSPWYRISACTGRPGCGKALADVQADARAAAERWPGRRVHWSGCDRRCGRSYDTEVDVVATAEGYAVHG
jgi:precorrin-3B synthase